jgi:hypothetical protein
MRKTPMKRGRGLEGIVLYSVEEVIKSSSKGESEQAYLAEKEKVLSMVVGVC